MGEKLEAIWQEGRTLANSSKLEEAFAKWQEGLRAAEEAKRDDYAGQMRVGLAIYHYNIPKDNVKAEAECLRALKLNPKLDQAHALLGRIYQRLERWEEAERELVAGLGYETWNGPAMSELLRIYLGQGRQAEAAAMMQRLKDLAVKKPTDPLVWNGLILGLSKLGTPEELEAAYLRRIEVAPKHGNYSQYAGWLVDRRRFDEAERVFQQALEMKPPRDDEMRIYYDRAQMQLEKKEPAAAEAILRQAAAIAPEHPMVLTGFGGVFATLDRPAEAEEAFKKSIAGKPTYLGCLNYGSFLAAQKRLPEAITVLKQALAINPLSYSAALSLASVYQAQNRPTAALDVLQKAARLNTGVGELHRRLGMALSDLGKYAEAEAAFQKAIAIEPNVAGYARYASLLVKMKRYDAAIAAAEKSIALEPQRVGDAAMRKVTALRLMKKYAEAHAWLDHLEKLDPADPDLAADRGGLFAEEKRFPEAESAFQESLRRGRTPIGLILFARFLAGRDKVSAAEALLQEALKMEPENPTLLVEIAENLQQQDRYEESIDYARRAVLLREKAGEKLEAGVHLLALGCYMAGRQNEALQLFGELAASFRASGSALGELMCVGLTAELRKKQSEYSEAIAAFRQVHAFFQRSVPPEEPAGYPPSVRGLPFLALGEIGDMEKSLGRLGEAVASYEKGIQEATASRADPLILAKLHEGLGDVLNDRNEYRKAVASYEKALAFAHGEKSRKSEANLLMSLLYDFRQLGDFGEAARCQAEFEKVMREMPDEDDRNASAAGLEKYLGHYEKVLGFYGQRLAAARKKGRRSVISDALQQLGHAFGAVGRFKEARGHYEEALGIELALPRPAYAASCQRGVAGSLIGLGNYSEARWWLEEALKIVTQIGKKSDITEVLDELGDLESGLGNYEAALAHYDAAQTAFHAIGDTISEAGEVQSKAMIHEDRGEYRRALELLQQALTLKRSVGQILSTASTLTAMGRQHMLLGETREAEKHFQQALEIVAPTKLSKNIANVESSVAELRVKQGKSAEAEKLLLGITAEDAKTGYPQKWSSWYVLGLAQKELKKPAEAIRSLAQSVEIVERLRKATRGSAADRLFLNKYRKVYREIIQLLIEQEKLEEAFRYIEAEKLAEIQENNPEPAFADREQEAAYQAARGLKFQELELQNQIAAELAKPEAKRDADFIGNLQSLAGQVEKRFNNYVENLPPEARGEFRINPFDLSAMRESLPPGVLAVQMQISSDGSEVGIIVHSQGASYPRVQRLEKVNVNREVTRLRNLLMDEHASDDEVRAAGGRLYDWLLRPIAAEMAGAKMVVLSPSGSLRTIPFQALYDRAAKKYVAEKSVPIVNLGRLKGLAATPAPAPLKIFAVANPDASDPRLALPKTEEQVAELRGLFPSTRVVAREQATLESLQWKPGDNDFNVLLFATHAALDEHQPRNSYIRLAGGKMLTQENIPAFRTHWPSVRLAVLSACETAAQSGSNPDNFALGSLAEKFDSNRIPSVLGSLWQVSDASSAELMTRFFRHLKNGASLAGALRQAQVELIRIPQYRHPFHWAPFILIGDWR